MTRIFELDCQVTCPIMIMLIGIPGSGKSYMADRLRVDKAKWGVTLSFSDDQEGNMSIFSSDALREEMFGNAAKQGDNNKLYTELHRRIKNALSRSENVVYDATNLNKRQRKDFLDSLKGYNCLKIAMPIMTWYGTCVTNNRSRDRVVPSSVMQRMYMNWCPPHRHEGFDDIIYIQNEIDSEMRHVEMYARFPYSAQNIDQENSHHEATLGDHCLQAYMHALNNNMPVDVVVAAKMHDIGKLETKTHINKKGHWDTDCHYYQHHCVGAYLYTLLAMGAYLTCVDSDNRISDVANLIYFHMCPYTSWKDSERSKERDLSMIGTQMFNKVMMLHECDQVAH